MICYRTVKRFCNDNIEEIENYAEAIADKESTWDCHHKMELHSDYKNTLKEMKMMNLYYNRPANELVFLKHEDHISLHHKLKKVSDITKQRMSNNHKGMTGKKQSKETINKIRKALTGLKRSEESKEKLSEVAKKLSKNRNRDYHGRYC